MNNPPPPKPRIPEGAPPLLVLLGPTGAGKSRVGVELALALNGEVVMADSMAVYRGLNIGTAKPTPDLLSRVPHHGIDLVDPGAPFSAALYAEKAGEAIAGVIRRGRLPVLVCGTGFYLDALLYGLPPLPQADEALRRRLAGETPEALYARLCAVDPETARALHPHNARRVLRALEVFELTGAPLSRHALPSAPRYRTLRLGLRRNRADLYRRIDARTRAMLRAGLVDEVRRLAPLLAGTARQAIGYKETLECLEGRLPPEALAGAIAQATRQYAKRQMTWFRRDPRIVWTDALPESDGLETLPRLVTLSRRWLARTAV